MALTPTRIIVGIPDKEMELASSTVQKNGDFRCPGVSVVRVCVPVNGFVL